MSPSTSAASRPSTASTLTLRAGTDLRHPRAQRLRQEHPAGRDDPADAADPGRLLLDGEEYTASRRAGRRSGDRPHVPDRAAAPGPHRPRQHPARRGHTWTGRRATGSLVARPCPTVAEAIERTGVGEVLAAATRRAVLRDAAPGGDRPRDRAGPRLLLLDEPTAGMNQPERAEIAELLKQLRDEGLTQLLIEHDVQMMVDTCDYALRDELRASSSPRARPRTWCAARRPGGLPGEGGGTRCLRSATCTSATARSGRSAASACRP